jgi:hypothetical protein
MGKVLKWDAYDTREDAPAPRRFAVRSAQPGSRFVGPVRGDRRFSNARRIASHRFSDYDNDNDNARDCIRRLTDFRLATQLFGSLRSGIASPSRPLAESSRAARTARNRSVKQGGGSSRPGETTFPLVRRIF